MCQRGNSGKEPRYPSCKRAEGDRSGGQISRAGSDGKRHHAGRRPCGCDDEELQGLGVHLSIDDFGTGYSSLCALKSFPVSRLKIDKSFIDGLLANENDKAVADAIVSLGQKLNLRVIAEGVETEAQAAFLRGLNCDEMQGYLFSKPLPAEGIEEMLRGTAG